MLFNTVLLAKGKRPAQASDQPPAPQQVRESRAFHDRRDAHCARPPTGRRLDDSTRPEGCVLCDFHPQAPPEVPLIQVEG